MVGQRARALGGVAEVEQHEELLVLGQAQALLGNVRVKAVEPAAVHARVAGGQDHVRGNDRGVLDAGVARVAGVGVDARGVEGHGQDRGRAVAAGRELVHDGERLGALEHVDVLLLQVLGGGGKPARLEDLLERLGLHLTGLVVLLARVALGDDVSELHVPSLLLDCRRSASLLP